MFDSFFFYQGDSGGPLHVFNDNSYQVVGKIRVLSFDKEQKFGGRDTERVIKLRITCQ